jgi:hypothetical protein
LPNQEEENIYGYKSEDDNNYENDWDDDQEQEKDDTIFNTEMKKQEQTKPAVQEIVDNSDYEVEEEGKQQSAEQFDSQALNMTFTPGSSFSKKLQVEASQKDEAQNFNVETYW